MRARSLGSACRSGAEVGAAALERTEPASSPVAQREGDRGGLAEAARAPVEGPRRPTLAALLFLRGRDADARLRALEAQRARVRPVLGALAVRLRETRGWRRLAFRTLSDYARERLGVGGRAVHEWARVWQALSELPCLREAVLAGEVSWTVARRVVRVATPETDAACVETVRGRTVRAVDELVARVRAVEQEERAGGTVGAVGAAGAVDAGSAAGRAGAADALASLGPTSAADEAGAVADASGAGAAGAASATGAAGATRNGVAAEGVEDEEAEERVAFRMTCPRGVGLKWNAAIELARRSKGEQLPVWACAELMAAEVMSALPPEREPTADGSADGCGVGARGAAGPRGRAAPVGASDLEPGLRAAAFPHLPWRPLKPRLSPETELELDRRVEGLEACGAHELDRRLRAAVGFLQSLDAELGRVLRQVVNRRLYEELGFRTFEDYVRERLDTAPRTAQRLVRLARAEHRAPAVAAAFRQGEITAFQADVLLGVVERGGPRAPRPAGTPLAELDGLACLRELAREEGCGCSAADRRASGDGQHAATGPGAGIRSESTLDLEARWLAWARRTTLRRLEVEANAEPTRAVGFTAPPDVVAFFRSVLHRVHRRLVRSHDRQQLRHRDRQQLRQQAGSEAELPPWAALEAMLEHVILHWLNEERAAARRKPRDYADFFRDGNRCTMPGCTARAMLERHHIQYRSDRGPDVPANRTSLCAHHHAAVHQQRARIAGRAPDRLLFELGLRPDGPPLARYRSGDVAV